MELFFRFGRLRLGDLSKILPQNGLLVTAVPSLSV
jgi:hypothetical protein